MGALFDQSLILRVGQRDDTRSAGRPVATLTYSVGRMRGEMSYVIDHEGLSRFTAGIARALGEWQAVLESESHDCGPSRP
jgi:hypothetical protein